MAMKSLEYKPTEKEKEMALHCSMPAYAKDPIFPSFYVDGRQMPEISDWEVGAEYEITCKIRVRMKRAHTDLKGSDVESDIEVIAYEVVK